MNSGLNNAYQEMICALFYFLHELPHSLTPDILDGIDDLGNFFVVMQKAIIGTTGEFSTYVPSDLKTDNELKQLIFAKEMRDFHTQVVLVLVELENIEEPTQRTHISAEEANEFLKILTQQNSISKNQMHLDNSMFSCPLEVLYANMYHDFIDRYFERFKNLEKLSLRLTKNYQCTEVTIQHHDPMVVQYTKYNRTQDWKPSVEHVPTALFVRRNAYDLWAILEQTKYKVPKPTPENCAALDDYLRQSKAAIVACIQKAQQECADSSNSPETVTTTSSSAR